MTCSVVQRFVEACQDSDIRLFLTDCPLRPFVTICGYLLPMCYLAAAR